MNINMNDDKQSHTLLLLDLLQFPATWSLHLAYTNQWLNSIALPLLQPCSLGRNFPLDQGGLRLELTVQVQVQVQSVQVQLQVKSWDQWTVMIHRTVQYNTKDQSCYLDFTALYCNISQPSESGCQGTVACFSGHQHRHQWLCFQLPGGDSRCLHSSILLSSLE